ncbi:MAG TPA: pilus assembly protein PilM [Candidatus Paceibacterota bacterium]
MFRNLYNRFFPTPRFLVAPSFGLDISDESLKFVEFLPAKSGIKMGRHGERKIPVGIIESGKIKDPKKLEEVLLSLKKEEGLESVRVSLPEEQVYLFRLRLSKDGLVNVREGIELALEEHIPIPAQGAIFDYDLLSEDDHSLELEVAAIPKNIIENYLNVFRNCFLSVESFELEGQAIARAVVKRGDLNTYMIVDFGQTRTGIFIVSRGVVVFTSTLDFGGAMLSQMIAKNFNVSIEEAVKMKMKFGLERNMENKEIFPVLLNGVSILRDEIVKHFLYWHTHKDDEGENRTPIKKIILCGGDSNLIGLAEYFTISIKSKVEIADVWVNVAKKGKYIPDMPFNVSLSFASALGLALGDFERQYYD